LPGCPRTAPTSIMAVSPQENAGDDEPQRSAPTKRLRWATQRVTGQSGTQKRKSIWNRQLNRMGSTKEKRESAGSDPNASAAGDDEKDAAASPNNRTIYFNQPLPPEAKDSEGHPLVQYKRNKIRTAKYTPISFLPKNLWLQFHNIANVYFLFIIILSVCISVSHRIDNSRADHCKRRFSPFLELRTLVSQPCH
jgi:phospholipid-translocating ATPase